MLGLYIHIPFCGKICDYCDFYAISVPERLFAEYLELVSREISIFDARNPGALSQVETLYLGGGTPSILPPELLDHLFSELRTAGVPLKSLKEATMEFNPESCDPERLKVALENGITRASIGIQSFNGELLARVGRRHTPDMGTAALELLTRQEGLKVNVDLMFNLPGQSLDDFLQDLDRLSGYPLGHISFYGLKVDPQSRLGKRMARGELSVDENLYADMYRCGVQLLDSKGFTRYETSNFAKPGCESLHNLNYWKRGEYFAFGPGAHGFFRGERFYAPELYPRWREYVRVGCPRDLLTLDPIGPEECLAEFIQLSLRTRTGVSERGLRELGYEISPKIVEKWISRGYLIREAGFLRLVGDGWLFMDRVVEDLFCNCRVYSKLD